MDRSLETSTPRMSWIPLFIGLSLLAGLTVFPGIAATPKGHADHVAASLLLWSMSAGFVRGVGFIPHNRPGRYLLSFGACIIALALAVLRIYLNWYVVPIID